MTRAAKTAKKQGRPFQAAPMAPLARPLAGRRFSFVGGAKTTLARLFREKGIVLTLEAQSRLDALPEQFVDFIAAPERFAVQWAEAA